MGRVLVSSAVAAVMFAVWVPVGTMGGGRLPSAADASAQALEEIPPVMLDIYRAAAAWAREALGCPVRWQLLAAVGMAETGHAHRRSSGGDWVSATRAEMTSSAGALGPMQFLPSSWASKGGTAAERVQVAPGATVSHTEGWSGHGVDAPSAADGIADVWDLADSVFGAAHYLCGNGLERGDESAALFAYNHSSTYVSVVLAHAERYTAAVPPPAIASAGPIRCPVGGPVSFTSSFGVPRSGGRTHQGNDLMAEEGTPTVAAEDGTVERTSDTDVGLGGIVVWLRGDSGASYYYAHHSRNVVGAGTRVRAGDVVGLVGHTGNAASTPPHLHFEIHPAGRGTAAVDPYPVLAASCEGVRR